MSKTLTRKEAEQLLEWAIQQNPGPWEGHVRVAARAAKTIAAKCGLDAEKAYVMGLMHDIGRFEGVKALHHVVAGYNLLMEKGYEDCARICMTHSFPIKTVDAFSGRKDDCTAEEISFIQNFLKQTEYDDYDRLIQLCDAISLAEGVALMDTRLMDVGLRHGFNELTLEKWKAFFKLKQHFDELAQDNIYKLFREEIMKRIFEK